MKKLIALLIISISLIGCSGNDVSTPEYTEPNRNEPTYNTPTYVEPEEKTDSTIVIDNGQYGSVSSDDKPTETANVKDESILNETETGTDESENSPPPFSDPVDIPSSMELHNVGGMDYYLYIPANPSENMPLVIYLHGGTNKRGATPELLTTDGFPKYLYDGYYGDLRAYVAVPKLDDSYKGWVDAYVLIGNLVKTLSDNYSIDRSNIALTGHSMGGTGTYQLQLKLQDTFARIAPLSGSVQNSEFNLEALRKTQIWAFVGTADTIVDPQSSRDIVSALQSSGASARITELDGATHFDVPSLAYKDPELIRWLIEGNSCL